MQSGETWGIPCMHHVQIRLALTGCSRTSGAMYWINWFTLTWSIHFVRFVHGDPLNIGKKLLIKIFGERKDSKYLLRVVVLQEDAVMEDLENGWQKFWTLQSFDWQNRYQVLFESWSFSKRLIEAHKFEFNSETKIEAFIFISRCDFFMLFRNATANTHIKDLPILLVLADECPYTTSDVTRLSLAISQWPCFENSVASWLVGVRKSTIKSLVGDSRPSETCVNTSLAKAVAFRDKIKLGRRLLKGAKLKVATYELVPFQMRLPNDKDGNIQYTGVSHDVFKMMTEKYNITYTLVEPPDKAFGASVNGTWNGMVGMVNRSEVDLGIACFVITYGRAQKIDYTWPFFEDPTGILIPPPQEETKLWACTKPFDMSVWLVLIVSTGVIGILLWIIMSLSWKYVGHIIADVCKPVHRLLSTQYLFLIGVVFSHANTCPAYSHSSRVMAAAWCLGAVVLVNVYTSMLISFLTIPKINPMADSIEDVAYNGRLWLTVWKSSSYDSMILGGISGAFRVLGETLQRYPENRVPSTDMGVQKVLTGKYAYIIEKLNLEHIVHRYWKEHQVCHLTIARQSFANSYIAFITQKRSPLLPAFNDEIRRFHETGLINYWAHRAIPPNNPCLNMLDVTPTSQSLALKDLQSAFLVLGLGIGLAITVFAIEYVVPKLNKNFVLPCTCSS